MNITTYLANKLLDHSLGISVYTPTASVHIALFKSNPTGAGDTADEVVGDAYARTLVTFNPAADRQSLNSGTVETPVATDIWGTLSHIALMDASTGGDMLYYSDLLDEQGFPAPVTVRTGQNIRFDATTLSVVVV